MSDEPTPIDVDDVDGQAFPDEFRVAGDMSVRTWGAFQLMAGLYASLNTDWHNPAAREAVAVVARRGADALLAELAKGR